MRVPVRCCEVYFSSDNLSASSIRNTDVRWVVCLLSLQTCLGFGARPPAREYLPLGTLKLQ